MKISYYEDTDSFFLSFGSGACEHTATVTDDFFVDFDSDDRLCGIESINASRHLRIGNLSAAPPRFQWVGLSGDEEVPVRRNSRDRFFIYRTKPDTLYLEFAGGIPADSVQVAAGIDGQLDDEGRVVGLSITNASQSLDLRTHVADGTPEFEWVAHRATATVAV